MKNIICIGALLLQIGWSNCESQTEGVGSFSYSDTSGRRYGGTYGLKDGQVVDPKGTFPPNFSPPAFPDLDQFFPEYFKNLEYVLQEAGFTSTTTFTSTHQDSSHGRSLPKLPEFPKLSKFLKFPKMHFGWTFQSSLENQKRAYDAAQKAFELTSNRAGLQQPDYNSYSHSGFVGYAPFSDFTGFGDFLAAPDVPRFPGFQPFRPFEMPSFPRGENSAMASGVLAPGYRHQMAAINPPNPNNPNVNINQFSDDIGTGPGYHSVSVSSYSSSSNMDGVKVNKKKASTIIDDNGKITKYEVAS